LQVVVERSILVGKMLEQFMLGHEQLPGTAHIGEHVVPGQLIRQQDTQQRVFLLPQFGL